MYSKHITGTLSLLVLCAIVTLFPPIKSNPQEYQFLFLIQKQDVVVWKLVLNYILCGIFSALIEIVYEKMRDYQYRRAIHYSIWIAITLTIVYFISFEPLVRFYRKNIANNIEIKVKEDMTTIFGSFDTNNFANNYIRLAQGHWEAGPTNLFNSIKIDLPKNFQPKIENFLNEHDDYIVGMVKHMDKRCNITDYRKIVREYLKSNSSKYLNKYNDYAIDQDKLESALIWYKYEYIKTKYEFNAEYLTALQEIDKKDMVEIRIVSAIVMFIFTLFMLFLFRRRISNQLNKYYQ